MHGISQNIIFLYYIRHGIRFKSNNKITRKVIRLSTRIPLDPVMGCRRCLPSQSNGVHQNENFTISFKAHSLKSHHAYTRPDRVSVFIPLSTPAFEPPVPSRVLVIRYHCHHALLGLALSASYMARIRLPLRFLKHFRQTQVYHHGIKSTTFRALPQGCNLEIHARQCFRHVRVLH